MDRKAFVLVSDVVRNNAMIAVARAPEDSRVTIQPKKRSDEQNDKLHAILQDIADSKLEFAGKTRSKDEWKVILVSGHSVATGGNGEVVVGLEGELVPIRESTAAMSVARAASLITYVLAFCDTVGIELHETRAGGYLDQRAA